MIESNKPQRTNDDLIFSALDETKNSMLEAVEHDAAKTHEVETFWDAVELNSFANKNIEKKMKTIIIAASNQQGKTTLGFEKNKVDIKEFIKRINRNIKIITTDAHEVNQLTVAQ